MQNDRITKLIQDCLGPDTGKRWPHPVFWLCVVWVVVDLNRAINSL